MKLSFSAFLLLVTIACSSNFAFGDWSDLPSDTFEVAPPPAPGSTRDKADFKKLHQLEEERTDEECRIAGTQHRPTALSLFAGRDGVLTNAQVNAVEPLISKVLKFSSRVAGYFKDQYMRPRPFNVDETLTPCIEKPTGSKAYPSSHAVLGIVGACVLAEVYKDQAEEINAHGKRAGELRMIAGVHHPSDIQAGWKLGKDICKEILNDPSFPAL